MKKLIALVIGLCALVGAGYFYWQSLVSETVPARVPIPASELQAGDGLGVWHVPESWRKERWHRTPVRILESGKALPLRVEEAVSVVEWGEGRFCIDGTRLWFSTIDGSNPLKNGRVYEAEIHRLTKRSIVLAVICLAVAIVSFFSAIPWAGWIKKLWQRGVLAKGRISGLGYLSAGSFALALLILLSGKLLEKISVSIPMNTGAVMYAEGGQYYYLPRWIRVSSSRMDSCVLYENQHAMRRATPTALAPGTYLVGKEEIWFSGAKGSSPAKSDDSYRLQVLLLDGSWWRWWSIAFFCLGVGLLAALAYKRFPKLSGFAYGEYAWRISIVAITLFKLWLIAGDDMMGQTADGRGYAERANIFLVMGEAPTLHGHPTGFPLMAAFLTHLGIPWRLGLEIFYLGMSCYLARGVGRLAGSRVAALAAYAFIALHPWSFSGLREFMPDPVTLLATGTLLGMMFRLLLSPPADWKWSWLAGMGLLLFVWESSRDEEPLLYLSYLVFVILALIRWRGQTAGLRLAWRRIAFMFLAPILIMVSLECGFRAVMYQHYGVYAKAAVDLPGLKALLKALYRIQPEQNLRYAPVTHQSLQAACNASPTLKRYEKALLDPESSVTKLGMDSTKIPGEFGPYLYWLVSYGCSEGNFKAGNQAMFKAAAEIQQALDEGRLPKRFAMWPLDPNWRLWLPDLPRCFATWFGHGTLMSPAAEPWGTYNNPIIQHIFDEAANRRAANIYPHSFLAYGAVLAPAGAVDSVAITDLDGRWRAASRTYSSNWFDFGETFNLQFAAEDAELNYKLLFLREGKTQASAAFSLTQKTSKSYPYGVFSFYYQTNASKIALADGTGTFNYVLDAGITNSSKKARRIHFEEFLQRNYKPALFCALAVVFISTLVSRSSESRPLSATGLFFLLASAWFTLRAAFYGLLVATMEFGQLRYMRCVSPLFILILFLAVISAAVLFKKIILTQKARRTQSSEAGSLRS